jgi:predicted  nucleic acid-binding Zn-ribbon protein
MTRPGLEKLKRILGLLGSDHAGERASAALAAHNLLQSAGTSWDELLRQTDTKRKTGCGQDYLEAAESRMRQLRGENERLEAQNKLLKSRLAAAREQIARARAEDESPA